MKAGFLSYDSLKMKSKCVQALIPREYVTLHDEGDIVGKLVKDFKMDLLPPYISSV